MAEFMNDYPTQRMKPRDGMAINAAVWQSAHDYHRLRDRWHLRMAGDGIVHGLEVVQTQPVSSAVWILPGFAIDAKGRTIVMKQAQLHDIGSTRGTIHVYLTASEHEVAGKPDASSTDGDDVPPGAMKEDVNIVASAMLPAAGDAYVELARIYRSENVAVKDAVNLRHPGPNEIDLRFRREVMSRVLPLVHAGIMHLGERDPRAREGWDALAQSSVFARQCRLCITDDAEAGGAFDLLYLRAATHFNAEPALVESLKRFLGKRGVLFAEAANQGAGESAAWAACEALFDALGVSLAPLSPAHPLVTTPHRFFQFPENPTQGEMRVAVQPACHAILSSVDADSLWRGALRDGPATREAIRASHEWGMNLLDYVLCAAALPVEADHA
jgi:hypothetical protein